MIDDERSRGVAVVIVLTKLATLRRPGLVAGGA